jgi:predicted nucleic acid-binding protein
LNNPIIVADASPLIAFARIEHLPLLIKTLGTMIIPESVVKECTFDKSRPGAIGIHTAIQKKIIKVYHDPVSEQFAQLKTLLGQGESAAIALA